MKSVTGREFCTVLERKGWTLARIKGSHHVYVKLGIPARMSVPVHGSKALKTGLLRQMMKLADIGEDDL